VSHRFTDVSWLALDAAPPPIPFSLGFRSQALTLTRVSVRTPGTFIRPRGFEKSFPRDQKQAAGPTKFNEDIGETTSLIFVPYYEKNGRLMDGILDQKIGDGQLSALGDPCRPEKETRILPGICLDCGWDLEGQSDSLVLVCRNCHTLWQPRQNALGRIRFESASLEGGAQVLIPFWRITARFNRLVLRTRADLFNLANLALTKNNPDGPVSFWAPAFKIRPKVFLRISRQLTLAQPDLSFEKTIQPQPHLPITLPATEAVQSIRITLASMARPLKDHFHGIAGTGIHAGSATLVYLPFDIGAHEYTSQDLGLAINKAALRLSENL